MYETGSGSKLGQNPGSGSKFYVFGSTTDLHDPSINWYGSKSKDESVSFDPGPHLIPSRTNTDPGNGIIIRIRDALLKSLPRRQKKHYGF